MAHVVVAVAWPTEQEFPAAETLGFAEQNNPYSIQEQIHEGRTKGSQLADWR